MKGASALYREYEEIILDEEEAWSKKKQALSRAAHNYMLSGEEFDRLVELLYPEKTMGRIQYQEVFQ